MIQRSLRDHVNGVPEDTFLMFLEHTPVYTAGRHSRETDLLSSSIKIYSVERGGSYTYHGPGQLVVYFILNLNYLHITIKDLLKVVEDSEVKVLSSYGIQAESRTGKDAGVWLGPRKISSTGLSVKEFATMHGIALNINTDLDRFNAINPCGFPGSIMTSMSEVLGKEVDVREVRNRLFSSLLHVLGQRRIRLFYNLNSLAREYGISEQLSETVP